MFEANLQPCFRLQAAKGGLCAQQAEAEKNKETNSRCSREGSEFDDDKFEYFRQSRKMLEVYLNDVTKQNGYLKSDPTIPVQTIMESSWNSHGILRLIQTKNYY